MPLRCAFLAAALAVLIFPDTRAFAWEMNPDYFDPVGNETHFRRAMFLWRTGDLPGVLEHLDKLDPEGAIVDTARALPRGALLRAAAAMRLADRNALEASLNAAASLPRDCPELPWIAAIESMARVRGILPAGNAILVGSTELPDAVLMRADSFLREGRPEEAMILLKSEAARDVPPLLREWWLARASGDWNAVVVLEPRTPFEQELFGAAGLKLAAQALETGQPAADILSRIPGETIAARRAQQIQGILAMSEGDSAAALSFLTQAQKGSFETREDREIGLASTGLALEQKRWNDAHRDLTAIEASWLREKETIRNATPESLQSEIHWSAWLEEWDASRSVLADTEAHDRAVDAMVEACVRRDSSEIPALRSGSFRLASAPAVGFELPPPSAVHAAVAKSLAGDIQRANAELLRDQRALLAEQELVGRELAYLQRGAGKTDLEIAQLRSILATLESLRVRGMDAAGKLAILRDEEVTRIAERTARLLERSEENAMIAGAIRRFRAEGPKRLRPDRLPPGVPSPDSVAVQETAAADSLHSWIRSYSIVVPELVQRSHAQIWEPRASRGPDYLAYVAKEQLAWSTDLRSAIDSAMTHVQDPERMLPLEERCRESARLLAQLQKEEWDARRTLLVDAIDRARSAHELEGEGIAFSLSIASHEWAAADARDRARREAEGEIAAASEPIGSEAHQRLSSFLDRYPNSPARAEIRYRLADLEISRARADFASKMASFVGGKSFDSSAPVASLAPFVHYDPALDLYRKILREDVSYEHRDAVLFHTGMILSDQGDPEARSHLEELVANHSSSPFCGRASLRMGDDDFEQRKLESAATHFETAAAKGDDEVRSIALYKLGWVFFNLDRFDSASQSFFRLLDLYEKEPDALALTDLRREAEESLVQSLARGNGAQSFSNAFGDETTRSFDLRVLSGLAAHLRELSQYEAAASCDSLLLARHAAAPEALDAAQHLVATLEEANRADRALEARLAFGPRFSRDSDWARGIESDSLRTAGDDFARGSLESAALERHRAARESKEPRAWEDALALHESFLAKWPGHEENARTSFLAGEASLELGRHSSAIEHFTSAAQDSGTLGADASWQLVAVRDSWYENARQSESPSDSLASALLLEIDRFTFARAGDPRCPQALWRKADVAERHTRFADAAEAYESFASSAPADPRVAEAQRAAAHCRFRNAETADADSSRSLEAAQLFELVVQRSPSFEHGDAALYRAGLAYERAGSTPDAVRTWSTLLSTYPQSELSRDAHLQIAAASKNANRLDDAAHAYERFSQAYPDDPEAAPALLEAADLLAKSSDESGSEALRTRYLERYPQDTQAAFEILGARAERELADTKPGQDLSALPSLARYRELAEKHPDLGSPTLLANASFLEAEQARQAYEAARLTQPLAPALATKKALLETVLREYRQCTEAAVEPWSVAGAFRIGESLVTFGEALGESERPADMSAEDLAAYEEVLETQKWEFFDRGEQAWTELLKSANPSSEEGKKWMARTREVLWPRIARRFLHRPELEYPLLGAEPPKESTTQTAQEGTANGSGT